MARIKLVETDRTPFHVKDIFDRVEKLIGVVPNQLRAVANSPDFVMPLSAMMAVVHLSRGMSKRIRQLAVLKVSKLNGSEYDVAHNTAAAMAAGITEAEIASIDRPVRNGFSDAEIQVMSLAEKLTLRPKEVSEADIAAMRKFFSDAEIMEIVFTIGVYNFTNRLNTALGIELEENFRFHGLESEPAPNMKKKVAARRIGATSAK